MRWHWSRFAELGVDNLYDALALRCRVFILEQGPYLDLDGVDKVSWHLLGRDDAGVLQAYLRLVDVGVKYKEASLGRVITAPEVRHRGVGRQLVAQGLAQHDQVWPGQGNRISAQAHLKGLYAEFGFVADGDVYLEDDIPHLKMIRPAR
jgi:ElaA protein